MKVFGVVLLAGILASTASAHGQAPSRAGEHPNATEDISKEVVDAAMVRMPTAYKLGEWGYSRALFLLGDLSVYRRTHDPKYLEYAKEWADSHIGPNGQFDQPMNTLDFMMPGNVLVELYQATGDEKYKRGAEQVYAAFATYSRNPDGAMWHAENGERDHQLWLDGAYMGMPLLVRTGTLLGHAQSADEEAEKQVLLYDKHLKDPNGPVYFHAYDESGVQPWSNATTHRSSFKWGRSIGWYSMALVDVLDGVPANTKDPVLIAQRKQMLAIIQTLARDLAGLQDPATGLWWQVIDQPTVKGNFLETSCSSMYTYFLDIAVKRGYIPASYKMNVERGRNGVLSKITFGPDGQPHIADISEGTNVSDLAYYLARKRPIDDFHGLGAFLLMNEEVEFNQPAMQLKGFPGAPGAVKTAGAEHVSGQ